MMSSKNLILIFVLSFCVVGNATAQKKKKRNKRKKAKTEMVEQVQLDSASYAIGIMLATDLKKQGLNELDARSISKAIKDVIKGNPYFIAEEDAANIANQYRTEQKKMQAIENLKKGEEFLAKNAEREGIIVTDSGLQYEILEAGDGPTPTSSDKVKTHYHGTLIDGTVFDSSVERGKPISFPVMGVIKGWQEVLQLMPVGSKWRTYIPAKLAYGERGAGKDIGPNSALIFDIELLGIE